MSKKIIIIIIAVVLVLVAVFIWWLTRPEATVPIEQPSTNTTNNEAGVWQTDETYNPTPEQVAATSLKNEAARFVEIYGSYSSDANFANLLAVKDLVTENYWQSMQSIIDAGAPTATGFYGVTTKALITNIESETAETAEVLVKTQRQELFSGQGEPQLRYQDIRLSLVRSGNNWLISQATWITE